MDSDSDIKMTDDSSDLDIKLLPPPRPNTVSPVRKRHRANNYSPEHKNIEIDKPEVSMSMQERAAKNIHIIREARENAILNRKNEPGRGYKTQMNYLQASRGVSEVKKNVKSGKITELDVNQDVTSKLVEESMKNERISINKIDVLQNNLIGSKKHKEETKNSAVLIQEKEYVKSVPLIKDHRLLEDKVVGNNNPSIEDKKLTEPLDGSTNNNLVEGTALNKQIEVVELEIHQSINTELVHTENSTSIDYAESNTEIDVLIATDEATFPVSYNTSTTLKSLYTLLFGTNDGKLYYKNMLLSKYSTLKTIKYSGGEIKCQGKCVYKGNVVKVNYDHDKYITLKYYKPVKIKVVVQDVERKLNIRVKHVRNNDGDVGNMYVVNEEEVFDVFENINE